MKENDRTLAVKEAERRLDELMVKLVARHRLTYTERFAILSSLLAETAKFALLSERDPAGESFMTSEGLADAR